MAETVGSNEKKEMKWRWEASKGQVEIWKGGGRMEDRYVFKMDKDPNK